MDKLLKFVDAGISDEMLLSEKAKIRVVNSSILAAILVILSYNIFFYFIAKPLFIEMTLFRFMCTIILFFSWYMIKKGRFTLGTHIVMITSCVAVFQVSYFYLGPDYGLHKLYIVFAMIPFIYFRMQDIIVKVLYGSLNLFLYFYLDLGTYDYVFKPDFYLYNESIAEVFSIINISIGFVTVIALMYVYEFIIRRDEKDLISALKKAKHHSEFDYLTGALNRRTLSEIIDNHLVENKHFALLMWDIDNFKAINDSYGHIVGDDVLKAICHMIIEKIDEKVKLARWGGEEFVILMEDASLDEAEELGEIIRQDTLKLEVLDHQHVSISIGIATRKHDDNFSTLLMRVDELMYRAKENGKNQWVSEKGNIKR